MADNKEQHHFIACGCISPSHIVQITYWPGYESTNADGTKGWSTEGMSMNIQLNLWLSFWKRLKVSFRYLFKPTSCAKEFPWDGNWMEKKEIDSLRSFLNGLERDSNRRE